MTEIASYCLAVSLPGCSNDSEREIKGPANGPGVCFLSILVAGQHTPLNLLSVCERILCEYDLGNSAVNSFLKINFGVLSILTDVLKF